jgi:predicted DNA-binding protein
VKHTSVNLEENVLRRLQELEKFTGAAPAKAIRIAVHDYIERMLCAKRAYDTVLMQDVQQGDAIAAQRAKLALTLTPDERAVILKLRAKK